MISQSRCTFSRAGASLPSVYSFCLGSEGGNYPSLMLLESLFVSNCRHRSSISWSRHLLQSPLNRCIPFHVRPSPEPAKLGKGPDCRVGTPHVDKILSQCVMPAVEDWGTSSYSKWLYSKPSGPSIQTL